MLSRDAIEKAIISAARLQGLELNGKDLLDLRTGVAATLASKGRYRQRMNAPDYQWKKPELKR
ncbi:MULTISPECIES: hypothetical protein [Serratia]|uniref:hypothetical protein n=1 Tax=Serratia TaxID=613 RepID=UPI00157188E1|nr:hypothetical protein [Serratia marcescens]MBH2634401.1 hypothetical protein [Serratia marcescens]NSM55728.1 hypothetical protein [Serratia marcescens]HAT3690814.1 hypothetical protein [Serratia marcescens]